MNAHESRQESPGAQESFRPNESQTLSSGELLFLFCSGLVHELKKLRKRSNQIICITVNEKRYNALKIMENL